MHGLNWSKNKIQEMQSKQNRLIEFDTVIGVSARYLCITWNNINESKIISDSDYIDKLVLCDMCIN